MTEKTPQQLREEGYAVVIFYPEELEGVDPTRVENRLIDLGWDVIACLKDLLEETS